MGDVSVLMTLYGAEPVLGIGDLDGDGEITGADLEILSQMTNETRGTSSTRPGD
jgi:hypothetical protein